jgi:putative FmdB family regulatory protein
MQAQAVAPASIRARAFPRDAYTSGVPIYEYVCMQCESHFEELVRNGERPDCPECGAADVRKQLSVFSAHASSSSTAFDSAPRSGGGCCGGSCGCG